MASCFRIFANFVGIEGGMQRAKRRAEPRYVARAFFAGSENGMSHFTRELSLRVRRRRARTDA
eukprot:440631-Lingulodinium_polyedra.AAC.1